MLKFILILIGFIMGIPSVMALEIISVEHQANRHILTSPAQKVLFPLRSQDKNLIQAMKHKLHDLGGVGLAAPQVNQAKQIIAVYIPEEAKLLRDNVITYPMHILINPSYAGLPGSAMHDDFESCYSVNSKAGKVPRYHQIEVRYYDESGTYHTSVESGFYARVLQHEIDHLNGTLITDRLTPDCVQGTIKEIMTLRRAGLTPEKRALFDKLMAKKLKK